MPADLKNEIRAALSGSSAQKPVDTVVLTKGHHRRRVEAVLMEMYQAREVCCCKIIKGGSESVVWWIAGNAPSQPQRYGKQAAPKNPTTPKQAARRVVRRRAIPKMQKAKVSRMSGVSVEVKDLITAQPGLTLPEVYARLNKMAAEEHGVRAAICRLVKLGYIRAEGVKRHFRYFPGEQA